MKKSKGEAVITTNPTSVEEVKKASGLEEKSSSFVFDKTGKVKTKDYSNEKVEFIKSRLPFKHALRLAFDGIKSKPIRLTFTIILAVVAFVFFGVSTSLMMYNPSYSIANALYGSNYDTIVLEKEYGAYFEQTVLGEDSNDYEHIETDVDLRTAFTEKELEQFNNNTQNLKFAGVMDFGVYQIVLGNVGGYHSQRPSLGGILPAYDYENYYPTTQILGFSDCGGQYLKDNGFTLIEGRYPETAYEVAIPEYVYEIYKHSRSDNMVDAVVQLNSPKDIIGLKIEVGNYKYIELTVTGVYDVGDIPERYDELLNKDSKLDKYSKQQLSLELLDIVSNSFHTLLFVNEDFYELHKNDSLKINDIASKGLFFSFEPIQREITSDNATASIYNPRIIWKYDYVIKTFNLDGTPSTYEKPKEDEVYMPIRRIALIPTTNGSNFYTKFAINPANAINHPRFAELLLKYNNYNSTLSTAEIIEFVNLLFPIYKEVIGEELDIYDTVYAKNQDQNQVQLKVKGYFIFDTPSHEHNFNYLVSDEFTENFTSINYVDDTTNITYISNYEHDPYNEKYGSLITKSDNLIEQTYFMLNSSHDLVSYKMTNLIYKTTAEMANLIFGLKILFFIAAGLFGLFAALMLFNFITVSISSKNKEIGILRAVGARKNDVFKIFSTEAIIIGIICFIISAVLSGFVCSFINNFTLENSFGITLLDYTILNVVFILILSIIVSVLATVIPVTKAANKSPVESIRSL